MASITATCPASLLTHRASLVNTRRLGVSSSPESPLVLVTTGLLSVTKKKVVCSMEVKAAKKESNSSSMGGSASWVGAAAAVAVVAATCSMSSPAAMALVDDRMSTEGTGLPFGLSNNLLGWLLLGVFALIWSLYFVYTSGLDEDDDSGLSL